VQVWIDIENPPQVQYLLPFKRAFEAIGVDVAVTARDYGFTYDLLRGAGVAFEPVGASYGQGARRKAVGLAHRTSALTARFARRPRPGALVCAGRASVLAARALGITSFALGDYEYVHQRLYRHTRSFLVFPDVIDSRALLDQGIRRDRLIPYQGIKEDLTFSGVDLDAVDPHAFGQLAGRDLVKILFRPAAEQAHYYTSESGRRTHRALERLAERGDAVVIFSPRYPHQVELLRGFSWANEPIVLDAPVDFISLLKGVDAVVSAGGTMLREAAYLGVPAYSLFGGRTGGVDRHLEALGRLRLLDGDDDLSAIARDNGPHGVMRANPRLLDELVATVMQRAGVAPAAPTARGPVASEVCG
jgi:uncharacterized protein